jgi:quinol-cytochrome oxidoreductase complex cytochrome b subunit
MNENPLIYLTNKSWSNSSRFIYLDSLINWSFHLLYTTGSAMTYLNNYVNRLLLPFSSTTSIIGFMLLLTISAQLISGFFLGWYYIPEPGLVIELREEMFNDTRFGVEVFYIHVRGVDTIFVLSYLHVLKKIYIKNYIVADSDGWLIGGYAFFWLHLIVFFGISLSATHLSDLTLTIGANIFWSLLNFTYKTYYILFTNKHLNTDQLTRFMLFHYFTPWFYLYLIQVHVMFCHESWDTDSGENTIEDKSSTYISWFYDAFLKEIQDAWFWTQFVFVYFVLHHFNASTVTYHFFERWNISELDEIRFYGVAPHWYFRPLMGLLTITPTHYEGLLWMGMWFLLIAAMPLVNSFYNSGTRYLSVIPAQNSLLQTSAFITFMLSMYCAASMLPCGRYYYDPEGGYVGNPWVKFSYQYAYLYLAWIIHHLDRFEHYGFNYARTFRSKFTITSMTQTQS